MKRKAESIEAETAGATMVPTDAGYIRSLTEPFHTIATQAKGGGEDAAAIAPRLDTLEMELRSGLLELFHDEDSAENNRSKVGDYWKSSLNLCIHLVHTDKEGFNTVRKLPFVLLEDCLDGLSVDDAQQFWIDYVEPSMDNVLLGELLWKSSNVCHLPFLRLTNHFLRVLENSSKSQEQEWKGRILLALSKAFSISDRSALKLWGTFHSANNTSFESKDDYSGDNYNLYAAFWSLQADFSNPNRIQVAQFIKKMKAVLSALESSTSTTDTTPAPAPQSVRYLTSSSLLPTQMASKDFRSCVLTQFLIVSLHLSAESPPLANALSSLIATSKKLLKKDNPPLHSILDSLLQTRESQWRQWKKEKCPASAFAPKQKATAPKSKRTRLLDGPLGSSESSEHLYEVLGNDELIQISQELVQTAPSLENHLEPYVEALDPESGIEEDYHPKNDAMFTWRAMRLMRQHQPEYLKHCRQPADLELMTREFYKSQGTEIPGKFVDERSDVSSDSDDDDDNEEDDDGSDKGSSKGDEQPDDVDDEEGKGQMDVDEKEAQDEEDKDKSDEENDAEHDSKDAMDTDEPRESTATKEAEKESDDEEEEKQPRGSPVERGSSPEKATVKDGGNAAEEGSGSPQGSPRQEEDSGEDEGVVETSEKQDVPSRSPAQQESSRSASQDRGVPSPPREMQQPRKNPDQWLRKGGGGGGGGGGRRDGRRAPRNDGRGRNDDGRGRMDDGHRQGGGGHRGGRQDHPRGRQEDTTTWRNEDGRRGGGGGGRRDDGAPPQRRHDEGGRSEYRGGGGGQGGMQQRDGRGGERFGGDRGGERREWDDRRGGGGGGGGGGGRRRGAGREDDRNNNRRRGGHR